MPNDGTRDRSLIAAEEARPASSSDAFDTRNFDTRNFDTRNVAFIHGGARHPFTTVPDDDGDRINPQYDPAATAGARVAYVPDTPDIIKPEETTTLPESFKVPMLWLLVCIALLAAAWNYYAREQALNALADTQAKLAVATAQMATGGETRTAATDELAGVQLELATERAARRAAEGAIAKIRAALASMPVAAESQYDSVVHDAPAAAADTQ